MRAVQWKSCGKSPKLVQGYFLCKNRRISWRKDAQKLDLSWFWPWVSPRWYSVRPWGLGVVRTAPTALRSPEMEETTLSRLRVKYEVVTPLGDEDILDWREIAVFQRFRIKIVRIWLDFQDCLRSGLIYIGFPYIFGRFSARLGKTHIYSENTYGIFEENLEKSSNFTRKSQILKVDN